MRAMTGAAPVPVPPPIPAVMNTISVSYTHLDVYKRQVNKQAAIYVKDSEAETTLMDVALSTVNDEQKLKELKENIAKLALPDSARIIAQEVIKLAEAKS